MFDFNENYFEKHQKGLLFIANKWYLRWLIGLNRLPEEFKKLRIDRITNNSVHHVIESKLNKKGKFRGQKIKGLFFTRPRFAEALAYNLSPFSYLSNYGQEKMVWRFSPIGVFGMFALFFSKGGFAFFGTTTTYNTNIGGEGVCYRERVESFASCRAGTVADSVFKTTVDPGGSFVQTWVSGGYNPIRRCSWPFDTSALGTGATISAASLNIRGAPTTSNSIATNIYTVQTTIASNTNLVVEDFDQFGSVSGATETPYASWLTSAYNVLTLNSTGLTWISKTGYTKLGNRDGLDFLNTGPTTGNNSVNGYFSDYTGTTRDPYLSVTYTTGTSYTSTLTETITNTTGVTNLTSKLVTETMTNTATFLRNIYTTIANSITNSDTVTSMMVKVKEIAETITTSEYFTRFISKPLLETMSMSNWLSRISYRTFSQVITMVETAIDIIQLKARVLLEEITTSEIYAQGIISIRNFVENITNSSSLLKTNFKSFVQNITIGNVVQAIIVSYKELTERLSLTQDIKLKLNGVVTNLWSRVKKNIGDWRRGRKDF